MGCTPSQKHDCIFLFSEPQRLLMQRPSQSHTMPTHHLSTWARAPGSLAPERAARNSRAATSDRLRKPTSSDRQQANFLIASGEANFLSSRVSSNNQPQSHIEHPHNHYDWRKVHTFFAHRHLVIEVACVSRAYV